MIEEHGVWGGAYPERCTGPGLWTFCARKGGIAASAPTGRRIPAQGATLGRRGLLNGEWKMENGANTRAAPATHTSCVEIIPLGCRLLLIASTRAVLVVGVTLVFTAFSILHSPF